MSDCHRPIVISRTVVRVRKPRRHRSESDQDSGPRSAINRSVVSSISAQNRRWSEKLRDSSSALRQSRQEIATARLRSISRALASASSQVSRAWVSIVATELSGQRRYRTLPTFAGTNAVKDCPEWFRRDRSGQLKVEERRFAGSMIARSPRWQTSPRRPGAPDGRLRPLPCSLKGTARVALLHRTSCSLTSRWITRPCSHRLGPRS